MSEKTTTSFVTKNTDDEFSFVHTFPPQKENIEKGEFFVVFTVKKNQEKEDQYLIQDILTSLYRYYFRNDSLTLFNALVSAVRVTKENIEEIVSLGAVVVLDNYVYTAAVGGSGLGIYRNGSFSKILTSKDETISASGKSKEGDILVLGTNDVFEKFDEITISAFLKNDDLDRSSEQFDSSEKFGGGGLCLVSFRESISLPLVTVSSLEDDLASTVPTDTSNVQATKRDFSLKLGLGLFKKKEKTSIDVGENLSYEDSESLRKERRKMLSIGIVVLVMLFASIGFGMYQTKEQEALSVYEPRLVEAQHNFDQANNLTSLSADRAREHFQVSRNIVDILLAEGVVDERLSQLDSDLSARRGAILGEYKSGMSTFYDLSILADEFMGDDLAVSDDVVYVLDRNERKAISVALSTKGSEVFAGPGSIDNSVGDVAASSDRVYIITDEKIVRIDSQRDEVMEDTWKGNPLLYSYAGNLYVLEKQTSRIIRYSAFSGGFADGSDWLVDSADPDLSKILSWAIDGSIWMVSESGGVFRFSLGNQVDFDISGLNPSFMKPTQIYTNDEIENVYVLEPSQERVVVLTKEGVFVAQYVDPALKDVKDFGVSEEEKLLIFLVDKKLLQMPLEHL